MVVVGLCLPGAAASCTNFTVSSAARLNHTWLGRDYNATSGAGLRGGIALGDLNGDGVEEMCFFGDSSVYVAFMDDERQVQHATRLSGSSGGLGAYYPGIGPSDAFGASLAALGDQNGDGVGDLLVAAIGDGDGGSNCGAVYVIFLEPNGFAKGAQKISALEGGLSSVYTLKAGDRFGHQVRCGLTGPSSI